MQKRKPGYLHGKKRRLSASQMPSAEPPACVETRTSFRANIRVSDIAINPDHACTFLTKAMNRWTAGNWYLPRI